MRFQDHRTAEWIGEWIGEGWSSGPDGPMAGWIPRYGNADHVFVWLNVSREYGLSLWLGREGLAVPNWRHPEAVALGFAVASGECEPGILADFCDEHPPTSGVLTADMGDIMRWAE